MSKQAEIQKSWYVLSVMGGKEKKTVSFIEKEIDRINYDLVFFIDDRIKYNLETSIVFDSR